jgi:large subunit ribosomal protein L29
MTTKEIREKSTEHLGQELLEQRKHMFDLRSQAVTEKLEDPSQLKKTRRDIARMLTVLRQRELEGKNGPDAPARAPKTEKSARKPKAVKKTAKKTVKKKTTTRKRTTKAAKAE